MRNSATSDHQHASNTSVLELLKGQHDDVEQGCTMTLMCLKGNVMGGKKTLNEERKKTESHSAIEHSIKTGENQWDYLVCADGAWLGVTGYSGPVPTQCSNILKHFQTSRGQRAIHFPISVKNGHFVLDWTKMTTGWIGVSSCIFS